MVGEEKPISLFRPVVTPEAKKNVNRVFDSGWIGLGPETQKFEEEFADYVGAKYAVGLNSATAGLHLALKLIDVNPSDEIISTSLSFISTNMVILYEGATPVFADVERDTLNINPFDIERKITNKTKAIICVHYRGHPCEMDEINKIAKDNSLFVIEDGAHSMGAKYKGKRVGGSNNINIFSFHAVKNLPVGDGGMITTNNDKFAERLKRLRWLGIDKDTFSRTEEMGEKWYAWRYTVAEEGYKYHMNDIQAAIGRAHLQTLDEDNRRRSDIVKIYKDELVGVKGIELLKDRQYVTSANHIFAIKAERRNRLLTKFKESGVSCGVHYMPNHLFPVFRHLGVSLPILEEVWTGLISLPLHLMLTDDDVMRVCKTIKEGW